MSEPSNKSDSVTVSKEDTIMSETSTEVSKPSSEGAGNEANSATVPNQNTIMSELSTEVSKRRSEGVDETSKVSKEITNEILSELCSRLRVIIAKVTEMKASDNNDLKKVIFCFSFYPSVMLKSI
jgi:hypothetical protein